MSAGLRLALAAGVGSVAMSGCGASALTSGTASTASPPSPSSSSTADVAAAVVNINGLVPGGRIAGTGMVIEPGGVVLTNNHVVAGTTGLTAQVAGSGPVYPATVVGVDPTHDVAVIRLQGAPQLPTVPLDTSGVINTGDDVTGMGNALGADGAPVRAVGTVTSLDQTLTVSDDSGTILTTLNGLIQFSAPIQPGDSGGPLLDAAGRVIGMDTAASPPGTTSAAASFGVAIPINGALDIAHQILSGVTSGYIQSGHTGALGVILAKGTAVDGAPVSAVTAGDAAATAGIVAGDIITQVGDVAVHSAADLGAALRGKRPGEQTTVTWRDARGAIHQAIVTLSPGPPA